jgi:hypothetical protein
MPLWLLGIGGWLKEAASAAFGWIRTNPLLALVIGLGCLSAWLWHGWDKADQRIAQIEAAQKGAASAQVAANHVPAAKSQAIAEKSNAEAPAYYDGVRRAAADHAIRVPSGNSISRPDLPGTDSAEQGIHGPAGSPDLVCRPGPDDSQLVTAAGRAAKMHQEALDLIAAGVAVPTP